MVYPPQDILHVPTKRTVGRPNHPNCLRDYHRIQEWHQHTPNLQPTDGIANVSNRLHFLDKVSKEENTGKCMAEQAKVLLGVGIFRIGRDGKWC